MRFAVRLLAVVSIVLLVTTLVVENVHAGPDIVTSPRLSLWVDIARVGVRTKLGPFDLAAPRLVDGRCSADGQKALLTFESPITAARTLVLVEFLATSPASAQSRVVTSEDEVGAVDAGSCGNVPEAPVFSG